MKTPRFTDIVTNEWLFHRNGKTVRIPAWSIPVDENGMIEVEQDVNNGKRKNDDLRSSS